MLSLRTHNIVDYVGGALLLLAPFLFGFADLEVARNVFLISGATLILYSLFTNYEYAVLRVLPLGVHMTLDVLIGVVLMVSPWLFAYREFLSPGQEYLHYLLGVGLFAFVGITREKTEEEKRVHGIRVDTTRPIISSRV